MQWQQWSQGLRHSKDGYAGAYCRPVSSVQCPLSTVLLLSRRSDTICSLPRPRAMHYFHNMMLNYSITVRGRQTCRRGCIWAGVNAYLLGASLWHHAYQLPGEILLLTPKDCPRASFPYYHHYYYLFLSASRLRHQQEAGCAIIPSTILLFSSSYCLLSSPSTHSQPWTHNQIRATQAPSFEFLISHIRLASTSRASGWLD